MDNSSAINWLLSDRFIDYVKAEELLEQSQNDEKALRSACTEQETAYAKAETTLRELEFLNTKLDGLLKITPSVNYEPGIVNLLERIKLYTATNSLLINFDKDIHAAIKIVNKLGFSPPKCGVFGLAAWLQDHVASWIFEFPKVLDYANKAAINMADANSTVQFSISSSNYLAQLQQEKQQALEEQINLQRELDKLRSRRIKLSSVMNELKEWSSTAYFQFYKTLNRRFQESQELTQDLLSLPLGLSWLAQEIGYNHAPWKFHFQRGLTEAHRLFIKHREWSAVSRIAERIYSLLLTMPPELASISPTEDAISKTINSFGIDNLNTVPTLERLYNIGHQTLEQMNRPSHYLWDSSSETLRGHSRPYCAAAKIKAIKRKALAIVQDAKPSAIEPTLRRIADETISSIVTSAQTSLNQLQVETEQEFRQMGEKLNEQMKLATNLQMQISATQEQINTSRCEGDLKFRRVISLLQEIVNLQHIPKPLRAFVEQYLQNTSDILREMSAFAETVNSWRIHTEKIEDLISSLDISACLFTFDNALKINIVNQKNTINCQLLNLQKSQSKLRKIELYLQKELENITTERGWWKQVWQAIPAQLKSAVITGNLKTDLEAVKLLITNPYESYRRGDITAEDYAMRVEVKVSTLVKRFQNYWEAYPKQQNEMRHEHTNYDELIKLTKGNDQAYMIIKKRVELAIVSTQVGSNEHLYETQTVA